MRARDLHDGWTVQAAAGPVPGPIAGAVVPAEVPGVVHLDLLRAGLIPDPYLDDNESALAWIGLVDWTYRTQVTITADELAGAERHELVFDGVDTVAAISLNGRPLAEVANQHRTHRLDVTDVLVAGDNDLVVAFRSPVKYANAQSVALGARERPYPLPYDAIRKSACSFGWDWGIATASSGLWRPVRLESWSHARLGAVRVHARPEGSSGTGGGPSGTGTSGTVRVRAEIAWAESAAAATSATAPLELTVTVAGVASTARVEPGETTAEVTLHLSEVERWWPVGHGAQPLYDVEIALADADGHALDATTRRVGFRDIRWDVTPDDAGTPFQLVVNDRPIFVKGVNWIPDDAFPSRVDRARYRARLEQAASAHINLIRVWGGGIYEDDAFYEVADELGLLTWQDFLFACAAYAEEEPLRSEIEAEVRDNVTRLAHHASLVLLTGNNENLWGYEDWGWKRRLDGRTWGAAYYYDLLPQVVAELAPHVPYAPGSPFSPQTRWDGTAQVGPHPNDERHGSMHLWEQWNRRDWPTYREHTPRFVAEFGWQAPPTWTTLTRAISDDPLTPESPGMIVHQKALEGNTKLTEGLVGHYRVPGDMSDWHWAMQLNQANAVTAALEWFRGHAPHTSGAVIWQLNDCWPVTSWAAVDGDGREKPLLHAIRTAFAPRTLAIQPRDAAKTDAGVLADAPLAVAVANDTAEPWTGDIVLRRVGFDGQVLAESTLAADVPAWGAARVEIPPELAAPADAGAELLCAEFDGVRAIWWFAEPRDSALAAPELSAEVRRIGDAAFEATVTAGALVRDLTLLVDRLDPAARVDRGLVTLLPGESATFRIDGIDRAAGLDAEAVLRPEVARSGNQLVVGR